MKKLIVKYKAEIELSEERKPGVETVSYTHLDVYKRQRQACPTSLFAS